MMDILEVLRTDPETGAKRLIAECGDRLYAIALRLCGRREDAEDLALQTLAQAVRRARQCKGEVFPWLRQILVNFHRMNLRRREISVLPEAPAPDAWPPTPEPGPCDITAARDDASIVRQAVAALPEPLRETVVLRYFEDLTVPETARVLGLPEGTVKSRLHEARRILRATLDQHGESHP